MTDLWEPLPGEQWRQIRGHETRYAVSSMGRVWSHLSQRLLRPYVHRTGYLAIGLRDFAGSRNTTYVHRLVALAFLGEPGEAEEVCHVDGDRTNPAASNLRWGTRSENMNDAVSHGTHHQSSKTHCKQGHEFTPETTSTTARGRTCRICARAANVAYRNRKSA